MKGYLSFVLAFLCLTLVIVLLSIVQASAIDLSDAVAAQRAYGVSMNTKEAVLESLRTGARAGFNGYDSTHLSEACMHCPDHFCTIPPAPNFCNKELCSLCFREGDARKAADDGVNDSLGTLIANGFDPDFMVLTEGGAPEVSLVPDLKRPGRYTPGNIRLRDRMRITTVSEKLGIRSETNIPAGMVVDYG